MTSLYFIHGDRQQAFFYMAKFIENKYEVSLGSTIQEVILDLHEKYDCIVLNTDSIDCIEAGLAISKSKNVSTPVVICGTNGEFTSIDNLLPEIESQLKN